MDNPEKLTLNAKEAAALLGVSEGSIYLALNRGELPCLTLGRRRLIPKKALMDLLASRSVKPKEDK